MSRPPMPEWRRRAIHGPLQPMTCERPRLSAWDRCCLMVALFAFAVVVVPGALWIARGAPQSAPADMEVSP